MDVTIVTLSGAADLGLRTVKYRTIDTSDNRWFAGRILKARLFEHREASDFVGFEGPKGPIAKHPPIVIIEPSRTDSKDTQTHGQTDRQSMGFSPGT